MGEGTRGCCPPPGYPGEAAGPHFLKHAPLPFADTAPSSWRDTVLHHSKQVSQDLVRFPARHFGSLEAGTMCIGMAGQELSLEEGAQGRHRANVNGVIPKLPQKEAQGGICPLLYAHPQAAAQNVPCTTLGCWAQLREGLLPRLHFSSWSRGKAGTVLQQGN